MTWPRKAITEVAAVNPKTPAVLFSDPQRLVDFVPMASLSEDGYITPSETRPLADVQKGYTYFENGDVLVAKITPCMENGKAAFVDKLPNTVGFGSTEFHVLRPNNGVSAQYLFWMVWSQQFRAAASINMTGSAGQKRVPANFFERWQIPLPPLPEQKRIAAILDAADALRAKRRESIEQLDSLIQATFLEMFGDPVTNPKGWEVGQIGDLMASVNYGTSKKAHPTDGAFPILRMGNITYQGGWDLEDLKFIDLDQSEQQKHLVHKGQLLFNRTNSKDLVGKTAVYRRDAPMAFAGYLVRAITNDRANPEYVGAFMNSPQTKVRLQHMCKNIVGMANINAKEFQAIPIPAPPVSLQNKFATVVESIEQQKARLKAHLAELDALFASLQSRAFNGELVA
jgi:type I restriction enzyme S subunit